MQLMVEDQELETAKTTMSEAKGFLLETTPTNPKLGGRADQHRHCQES